jgi:hypothetical protein
MVQDPKPISLPKKPISEYTSDKELAVMMRNAKKRREMDYWWECLRRRCEIKRQTSKKSSPLENEFHTVMLAYEKLQAEKTGRLHFRANRTWNMVKDKGVKAVLEKWALSQKMEIGFKVLVELGEYDLTGEYLVLKYQGEFVPKVVDAARKRLIKAGVSEERLPAIDIT